MEKVLGVAIVQALQKLFHEARYLVSVELEQARVEETEQIVIHVLEHQVEFATVFAELESVLLVGDNLDHVDNVGMLQLSQDLDLADGRDRETFFLVLQLHALQGDQLLSLDVARFEDFAISALADYLQPLEHLHTALAPVLLLELTSPLQDDRSACRLTTGAIAVRVSRGLASLISIATVAVQAIGGEMLTNVRVVVGLGFALDRR